VKRHTKSICGAILAIALSSAAFAQNNNNGNNGNHNGNNRNNDNNGNNGNDGRNTSRVVSVPEPETLGLLALGVAAIVLTRRRRQK
jgi:PEP-CTERM motif